MSSHEKSIDLHIHTIFSDGDMTPDAAVRAAEEKMLRAIAFTDHDTTSGLDDKCWDDYEGEVQVVSGVEVTTLHEKAAPHVVAYWLGTANNYANEELQTVLRNNRDFQENRRRLQVHRLNEKRKKGDFPQSTDYLSFKQIDESFRGNQVTWRPIADALVALRYACGSEKRKENFKEARDIINGIGYVRYDDEELLSIIGNQAGSPIMGLRDTVKLLSERADIVGIAHPARSKNLHPHEVNELIVSLKDVRLNAIEAYNGKHTKSDQDFYLRFAQEHNLLVVGGSDAMRTDDIGHPEVPYSVLERMLERVSTKG